jgi:deoxyribodipyrimidine photolyase
MDIEFYNIETGIAITQSATASDYFVMGGLVYRDNYRSCESQCDTVDFYTFIQEFPNIGWRINNDR